MVLESTGTVEAPRGRGAGRRGRSSEARRAAILEAALACFLEHGFAATTLGEVRRRSGASTGSIYHHFESKEQLAADLYARCLADYQRELLEGFAGARTARELIRGIVERHWRWALRHPDAARCIVDLRALAREEEVEAMNRAALRAFLDSAAPFVEAGELRDLPADVALAVLLGPSIELTRHWLAGKTRTDTARVRRELADAAWAAMRAEQKEER